MDEQHRAVGAYTRQAKADGAGRGNSGGMHETESSLPNPSKQGKKKSEAISESTDPR
jgi:hypothetical protein